MPQRYVATYVSEPFPTNAYDPIIFPGANFTDGLHRLLVMYASDRKVLYKTADFATFATVNDDWVTAEPDTGADTFQTAVVLGDGTFALYQNDGSEGTTAVWTGSAADIDAGTITKVGRVLATEGDCGAYYDPLTDLVHIFTEEADSPFGSVSSCKIGHWTTPADDLLTATQLADAVDTGGSWGTGDPHVMRYNDEYLMFCDYTVAHPSYWIALYRSDDLVTWELINQRFTESSGVRAGDFDVIEFGDGLLAVSEYTGDGTTAGVGVWTIDLVDLPLPGWGGSLSGCAWPR